MDSDTGDVPGRLSVDARRRERLKAEATTSVSGVSRRRLLYGLGGMAAAGAGLALGSEVAHPRPALAATGPGWFNVVDYGAQRSPATSGSSVIDSTPAFLAACRAAAAFTSHQNNSEDTGIVYVPSGVWVGRFEIAASGIVIMGDGWSTEVWSPPAQVGEAANNPCNTGGDTPTNASSTNLYPMVGTFTSNGTPVLESVGSWGVRDISFWTQSSNGTPYNRRVIDTTSPTGKILGRGLAYVDNVMAYGFAADVAFYFSAGNASFGTTVNRLWFSGPAEAMWIESMDSAFTGLYLHGGTSAQDAICRLRGAANRMSSCKIFAGGTWMKTSSGYVDQKSNAPSMGWQTVHGLSVEGGYNQIENIEVQDCSGYGLILQGNWTGGKNKPGSGSELSAGNSLVARNVVLGGNAMNVALKDPIANSGNAGHDDLDVTIYPADFGLTYPSALDLYGQIGNGHRFNIHVAWDDVIGGTSGGISSNFQTVRLLPGITSLTSSVIPTLDQIEFVLSGKGATGLWTTSSTSSTVSPDAFQGMTYRVTIGANTNIAAIVDRAAIWPGDVLVFIVQQDGVGGRTLTWDSGSGYYPTVPNPDPAPNAVTVYPFVNIATGSPRNTSNGIGAPVWQYVGS